MIPPKKETLSKSLLSAFFFHMCLYPRTYFEYGPHEIVSGKREDPKPRKGVQARGERGPHLSRVRRFSKTA